MAVPHGLIESNFSMAAQGRTSNFGVQGPRGMASPSEMEAREHFDPLYPGVTMRVPLQRSSALDNGSSDPVTDAATNTENTGAKKYLGEALGSFVPVKTDARSLSVPDVLEHTRTFERVTCHSELI